MGKLKFVVGQRIRIKVGDLKQTSCYCGVDPGMRDLTGKVLTISSINNEELSDGSLAVRAGQYFWHSSDLEKITLDPKPKGGSFKIENLVV
jgi:hypothetical protein